MKYSWKWDKYSLTKWNVVENEVNIVKNERNTVENEHICTYDYLKKILYIKVQKDLPVNSSHIFGWILSTLYTNMFIITNMSFKVL